MSMKISLPCSVCGGDLTTHWQSVGAAQTIHERCDTRPQQQRHRPHPAEGVLVNVAHDATLALAKAGPTPAGSAEWQEFDRLAARVEQVQHNNQFVDLGKAANYYVTQLGWPVFPLQPGGKTPLTRHGLKDASADPQVVAQWWGQWPEANIGLPTGEFFDVMDVDTPISDTLWEQISNDPGVHAHGIAATSGGGKHIFLEPGTAVSTPKNGVSMFGPGIDFRTNGGYVVAGWSRRGGGGVWQWITAPSQRIRKQ